MSLSMAPFPRVLPSVRRPGHGVRVSTRIQTIPIFKRNAGNSPEEEPKFEAARDENRQSSETGKAQALPDNPESTETQDILADWDGTLRDGTPVGMGWFGGDSLFTVVLIVGLSVVSTLFFTHGVSRFKHSKARRELRHRVQSDAPVTPREATAQRYPTGWPSLEDDSAEPAFSSSTVDGRRAWERERMQNVGLPLRTPEGERAHMEYLESQREKVQDFQARVDSIGSGQDEEAFDMLLDDDYAKGSRMSYREMKDRATKASQSAARAAAHAHQASIAATIASEACNEATAAAHRALEASMKTQRALERSSGQHIMEIYEATKKEEARAEKRARVAAEMSAKGLMEEFNASKASRKACYAADASRPRGLNVLKAWAFDVWTALSDAFAASQTVAQNAARIGKDAMSALKERSPIKSLFTSSASGN